ncbi:MAG: class I SAM-dependent methyltransferase [Rhodocyclaceae bacterium]|nr:MAG: class I SAM-dependent methyltransferase [Rhodocyclaceae bacterium]
MHAALPEPSADARAASAALCELIAAEIIAADGWIPFTRYMELALYAPGLGYYSGGSQKFGAAGDFITAPELTPLFAHTLAVQAAQVLADSAPQILEVGAGRGILAAQFLLELERRNCLPERYLILELSGELRARQRQTLLQVARHLAPRVAWLDALPPSFAGLVLGNEVLDAMPAALVEWRDSATEAILERGVAVDERGGFTWATRPARGELLMAAQKLAREVPLAAPYLSEIGLAARAWLGEWGRILQRGAVLLLDYGFPRAEYYFPQRCGGTLMCHYRHHAHENPLWWPGLNDITAHVDFTAVAEAGFDAGLEVLGYTSQAQFLLNCGITEILGLLPNDGGKVFLSQSRNVGKLISPHEMGELFKVIALGRGLREPLLGFARGDRLHTL